MQKHGISVHNRNTAITLFVDPYNFSTANIGSIKKFCNDNYADLFFNLFTSDFNRNKRIYKDKIDQLHLAKDSSIEELVDSIIKELKHTRNIKYCFDYKFMTSTNVELYRIVFATPHKKGLEKIKEVLWKIFDSNAYKNSRQETKGQLSLFDEDEIKESNKSYYAEEARNLLQQHFAGKNAKYDDIEMFIMEKTILASGDVIQFILKPMIKNGLIIKKNTIQNMRNYKGDTYYINK